MTLKLPLDSKKKKRDPGGAGENYSRKRESKVLRIAAQCSSAHSSLELWRCRGQGELRLERWIQEGVINHQKKLGLYLQALETLQSIFRRE